MNSVQDKIAICKKLLSGFKGDLELNDLRTLVLLALNLGESGAQAMLSKLGLGGKSKKIILHFCPERKIYFLKFLNPILKEKNIIYCKIEDENLHPEKLIHKPNDSDLLKKIFSKNELENLLPKSLILITPKVEYLSDPHDGDEKVVFVIDALFMDLSEYIISEDLDYIYLVEGNKTEKEPDLYFLMSPLLDLNNDEKENKQYFMCYLDEENKYRDSTFIRMKKDDVEKNEPKMELLNEITEFSHSELFNSHFITIIKIKSFDKL